LQALDGAHVTGTRSGIRGFGTVLLHQGLEFAFAERPRRQRNSEAMYGVVPGVGLAEFAGPIMKQLPLVSSLFWHLNRVFLHIAAH